MKHTVLVTLLLLSMAPIHAQWVISLQTGTSTSLRPANTDSVFAAAKTGLRLQATGSYYFGHLGISLTIGYTQRNLRRNKQPPPSFVTDTTFSQNGGFNSLYLLAGPEICISCRPKLRLKLHWQAGVSKLYKKPVAYADRAGNSHFTEINSTLPFTVATGVTGVYTINRHISMGLNIDHMLLRPKIENVSRRGVSLIGFQRRETVSLLNIAANFNYTL